MNFCESIMIPLSERNPYYCLSRDPAGPNQLNALDDRVGERIRATALHSFTWSSLNHHVKILNLPEPMAQIYESIQRRVPFGETFELFLFFPDRKYIALKLVTTMPLMFSSSSSSNSLISISPDWVQPSSYSAKCNPNGFICMTATERTDAALCVGDKWAPVSIDSRERIRATDLTYDDVVDVLMPSTDQDCIGESLFNDMMLVYTWIHETVISVDPPS